MKTLESKITKEIMKGNYGWIQWKGTNVCMDLHCKCGKFTHIDDDFVYYLQCPYCKQIYQVNGHVEMIPVKYLEVSGHYKIAEKSVLGEDFDDD